MLAPVFTEGPLGYVPARITDIKDQLRRRNRLDKLDCLLVLVEHIPYTCGGRSCQVLGGNFRFDEMLVRHGHSEVRKSRLVTIPSEVRVVDR